MCTSSIVFEVSDAVSENFHEGGRPLCFRGCSLLLEGLQWKTLRSTTLDFILEFNQKTENLGFFFFLVLMELFFLTCSLVKCWLAILFIVGVVLRILLTILKEVWGEFSPTFKRCASSKQWFVLLLRTLQIYNRAWFFALDSSEIRDELVVHL